MEKLKTEELRKSKRESLAQKKGGGRNLVVLISGIIIAAGFIAYVVYAARPRSADAASKPVETAKIPTGVKYPSGPITAKPVQVQVAGDTLSIPVSALKDNIMVSFSYKVGAGDVPLMAYIMPDGRIITAVSVCEPCNGYKFHIEGDELVCDTCGTRWQLGTHAGISGGCTRYPPQILPNRIEKDLALIPLKSIREWEPRR